MADLSNLSTEKLLALKAHMASKGDNLFAGMSTGQLQEVRNRALSTLR